MPCARSATATWPWRSGWYLPQLGLTGFQVGIVLTAAVAGSALMKVLWSLAADRFGRRRTVATMAVLMIAGGLLSDQLWLLVLGAFTGTISASSAEVGPFITVEQAILPQNPPAERRTGLFSIYDTLGNLAGAAGALFTGVVALFARGELRSPVWQRALAGEGAPPSGRTRHEPLKTAAPAGTWPTGS